MIPVEKTAPNASPTHLTTIQTLLKKADAEARVKQTLKHPLAEGVLQFHLIGKELPDS